VNAQLAFFAVDIATVFGAALLCLRVLTQRPHLLAAQLVALLAFNAICDVILGRSDYSYWIAPALQMPIHGWLSVVFNIARNLSPFVFAALCSVLFAEGRRFPWWLFALLGLQLFL